MKVTYKFSVKGTTRTTGIFPLHADGVEYRIETDRDAVVTSISLTYKVDDRSLWPSMTDDPEPGIAANITMHSPCMELAQGIVRAAEGVLSFFGVDQIDWNNPEEIYTPESEEERHELAVFSIAHSTKKVTALEMEPISFDIVARALLRARNLSSHEIPLAFYRKGKNDAFENRHIEACLDFLFMLETLFANGKFKTSQVVAEYVSSKPLLDAIYSTIQDKDLPNVAQHRGPIHRRRLEEKYLSKTPAEVAGRFVDLRGVLHHHSLKDKERWHPDRHDEFLADALFLQWVCFRVGMALFSDEVFSRESEIEYFNNYKAAKVGGGHT